MMRIYKEFKTIVLMLFCFALVIVISCQQAKEKKIGCSRVKITVTCKDKKPKVFIKYAERIGDKITKEVPGTPKGTFKEVEVKEMSLEEKIYYKQEMLAWKLKKPHIRIFTDPTIEYNCHGLTFANEKGLIDNVDDIIECMTRIERKDAKKGDIVAYWSKKDVRGNKKRTFHHTAIIHEIKNGTIWVRSKMGIAGECIHKIDDTKDPTEIIVNGNKRKVYGYGKPEIYRGSIKIEHIKKEE